MMHCVANIPPRGDLTRISFHPLKCGQSAAVQGWNCMTALKARGQPVSLLVATATVSGSYAQQLCRSTRR